MPDPDPSPADSPPGPTRFSWRATFHRSTTPVFVVGGSRRLRYANPAWEARTGRALADVRGTKIAAGRRSASPLWAALAPPAEAWAGRVTRVRHAVPPGDSGPPWWDVTFVPLAGPRGGANRPLAVLGIVTVVGAATPRGEARTVPAAVAELRREHAARFSFDRFAGPSHLSARLVAQSRHAARTLAPVWLVGEPGSGKETLARVIHHNGPAREKAFLGVDCAGLQPGLVLSLLFGKGGLAASGHLGTVYLKDPAALPRDVQDRIAGVFAADRPVGPRLICGSTRPAADGVQTGALLPAFQTALSVLEIPLPALRDRLDDLPGLVDRLLERSADETGKRPTVADDVWPALRAHDWPGNVRELADVLAAALSAGNGTVTAAALPRFVREKALISATPPKPPGPRWTLDEVLTRVETRLIELALRRAGNSLTDAAAALGVVRTRLARRVDALGIAAPTQPAKPRRTPPDPHAPLTGGG